jgi:hypothetical protein
MGGFWASGEYVGIHRSLLYPEESVSLDHYLIVEPEEQWQIFNWHYYFTRQTLTTELEEAGFTINSLQASLSGDALDDENLTLAAVARKKG